MPVCVNWLKTYPFQRFILKRQVSITIYILYRNNSNRIQVLIRVYAAGVNPADTYIRAGTYTRVPKLPYTPGSDAAGVIERISADVTNFKVQGGILRLDRRVSKNLLGW